MATQQVNKSYMRADGDEIKAVSDYCLSHSSSPHPVQVKLQQNTIKEQPNFRMLGAPEVLMLNQNIIRTSGTYMNEMNLSNHLRILLFRRQEVP